MEKRDYQETIDALTNDEYSVNPSSLRMRDNLENSTSKVEGSFAMDKHTSSCSRTCTKQQICEL